MCFSFLEVRSEWGDISRSEFHSRVIASHPNGCEWFLECIKGVALVDLPTRVLLDVLFVSRHLALRGAFDEQSNLVRPSRDSRKRVWIE